MIINWLIKAPIKILIKKPSTHFILPNLKGCLKKVVGIKAGTVKIINPFKGLIQTAITKNNAVKIKGLNLLSASKKQSKWYINKVKKTNE